MSLARTTSALLLLVAAACSSVPTELHGVTFVVEGNEWVADQTLLASGAQEIGAFGEDGFRAADAADAAYAMERFLRERGFPQARVDFALEPDEESPERLVFAVHEGPRVELGTASFPGGEAIRIERLRALLQENFPLPFQGRRPFRQSDVDEAMASVESMYLLAGFYDVRVGPSVITFSEDGARADPVIPIVEGERYTITRIALEGSGASEGELPEEVSAGIRSVLPKAGSNFHVRVPSAAAALARAWLRERGYQDGTARAERRIHDDEPKVTITIAVGLGPQYVIDQVTLTGLERTDPDFAYERLTLERGAIVRQSDLNDTIDALYGTGVFQSVDIAAVRDESDGDPLDVDIDFKVVENDARSFEVGGGWGSYEKLRGWVTYRDRNFTSLARLLELTAFVSLKGEGVEARVSDRYLLGKQRTLSLSARLESREEPSYDTDALTLDASIRQPLGPGYTVRYGYQIRFDDTSDLDGRIPGVDEGRSRAAGIYASVLRDTRDDRLFPTKGDTAEVGLFWSDSDLGGDLDFLEYKAVYARYFPIAHQTVLAIGGRFTTRDVLNDDVSLPIQERLFLGGENTIRSYKQDELGPTDQYNDPQGGLTSAMANVELRRRIWADLDGALFYEVGVVSPDAWDTSYAAGAAIGTGLRYRLPIGPIRVDFAYNPMHRFAAKRKWEIHLSFGFSF